MSIAHIPDWQINRPRKENYQLIGPDGKQLGEDISAFNLQEAKAEACRRHPPEPMGCYLMHGGQARADWRPLLPSTSITPGGEGK